MSKTKSSFLIAAWCCVMSLPACSKSSGGADPAASENGGSGGETEEAQGGEQGGGMGGDAGGKGGEPVATAAGASGHAGAGGMAAKPAGMGGQSAGGGAGGIVMPVSSACVAPACDDFEKYNTGERPGAPWSEFEVSATGSLAIDKTRAYSGTKAVKFTMAPSEDMTARMRHSGGGAVPGKEVFMRAMLFLEKPVTGQGVFHWNFMRAEGSGTTIVAGGNSSGKTFQNFGGGGRDCYVHGGNPIPIGKWVCVEYHVNGQTDLAEITFNGVVDEFTQVTNGNALPGLSGCLSPPGNNWNIPEPSTVRFGLTMLHELDGPVSMWMDDVVVSNRRIGCPSQK